MAKSTLTPFSQCKGIQLIAHDGKADTREVVDIAPTMKTITIAGKTYFRMKDCRSSKGDGEPLAMYLWDGWANSMMAARSAELEAETKSLDGKTTDAR